MRSLVKKLTRGMTFTRSFAVGGKTASIVVSPEAQLSYLKPGSAGFDMELVAFVEERVRPGMTVWDVGANVGLLSVAAAAMGAQVLAIEADIWLAGLLRRTAALNDDGMTVLPVAISDQCGVVQFNISHAGRASNAIAGQGRHADLPVRRVDTVPTLTLDVLLETQPPPDLIKIDVEGAEAMVLGGGQKVLAHGPELFVEVEAGNRPALQALLEPLGYGAHAPDGTPIGFDEGRDILYIRQSSA
ncbi:MAG: FkbM family methyltransferase [Pseudomonadota bacterium]